ncbi:unnamed protein product [Trichobilharzia regenti]|nr:unnamed protein product [Trichobilharzia regenti]
MSAPLNWRWVVISSGNQNAHFIRCTRGRWLSWSRWSREYDLVDQMSTLAKFEQSDDSDEHFSDAQCTEDEGETTQNGEVNKDSVSSEKSTVSKKDTSSSSSWYHRSLRKDRAGYNPTAREPKFSKAAGCLLWPLTLLSKHIHPTISLFANSLLNNSPIKYTGDPFTDFAMMHFLDRFAYKKPKVKQLNQQKSESGGVQSKLCTLE